MIYILKAESDMQSKWLYRAKQIQSVVQTGIEFTENPADNKWTLPGGWADIELTLRGNLLKESLEEAGAVIRPIISYNDK